MGTSDDKEQWRLGPSLQDLSRLPSYCSHLLSFAVENSREKQLSLL
ncbi:rCG36027 [Rattus norvegicus]|uniref:RCG36027 n=1 Tax=Rattus norvegicus TaxID=10116 RepID=A6IK88_RAT|nr:rCG36027 [Rattus norvegicus]